MSVLLNNLDDFIAPSQACVNPFVSGAVGSSSSIKGASRITLQSDLSTTEFEMKAPPVTVEPDLIRSKVSGLDQKKVARVSLNDCLACSGCVTSAETVLIQEQSYQKLVAHLADSQRGVTVVALSPQSRASLAATLGLSCVEVFLRVAAVLKAPRLGVTYVADVSSGADIALLEAKEEFFARFRAAHTHGRDASWTVPSPTVASSSTHVQRIEPGAGVFGGAAVAPASYVGLAAPPLTNMPQRLPALVSSCPGWVCYAEKSQPQALAFASTAKSAQQVLGSVVKHVLFPSLAPGPRPFVVCVQPCFDKKLEASRLDFTHLGPDPDPGPGEREVDLVISTAELLELLGEVLDVGENESLAAAVAAKLRAVTPDTPHGRDDVESMLRKFSPDGASLVAAADSNAGSGGFLDYVFRHAAQQICGVDLLSPCPSTTADGGGCQRAPLQWTASKGSDYSEVECWSVGSEAERRRIKFARVYGFRNIQSLMLKLKRGQCDLDYVEVMACPSGCVNGGGQLKPAAGPDRRESGAEIKTRVAVVERELDASALVASPEDSPLARFLYCPERLGAPGSAAATALLHTRFHAVPKLEVLAPLAAQW
jgi:iron only hydrogenase large subunit-like protein